MTKKTEGLNWRLTKKRTESNKPGALFHVSTLRLNTEFTTIEMQTLEGIIRTGGCKRHDMITNAQPFWLIENGLIAPDEGIIYNNMTWKATPLGLRIYRAWKHGGTFHTRSFVYSNARVQYRTANQLIRLLKDGYSTHEARADYLQHLISLDAGIVASAIQSYRGRWMPQQQTDVFERRMNNIPF